MKKQTVAVIGILQLVLGLVLAYQAGFASGGVFAPQSLKPNDIFYGSIKLYVRGFQPDFRYDLNWWFADIHNSFV